MLCANSHCEKNKTLLLISTTFPSSMTSADKLFCIGKGKKTNQISATEKLKKKWIYTEESDCNLHNVRAVATT
jgi:hypothetical protein